MSSDPAISSEVQSLIGLNTNLTIGDRLLHVQTEDLGRQRASIVTHVFSQNGQVIRKVRFSYSQHLDHPNLLGILPRAMHAQHVAVIQDLRKEGAEPAASISQTDLPCVSATEPKACTETPGPVPKQARPHLDPGAWDRLVAKAKAEKDRVRAATPVLPLPEANTGPTVLGLSPMPETQGPPRSHDWDRAIASARREFENTPSPDLAPTTPGEAEARRDCHDAMEQLHHGELETALILLCKAVGLAPRNLAFRRQLARVLDRMESG